MSKKDGAAFCYDGYIFNCENQKKNIAENYFRFDSNNSKDRLITLRFLNFKTEIKRM